MTGNKESADLKKELRRTIRQKRDAFTASERAAKGDAILTRLLLIPEIYAAKRVYSYICFQSEVPTRPIIRALLDKGKKIFTPAEDFKSTPHIHIHKLNEASINNGDFIPVPCPDNTQISDIDVFLVPGMVWDKDGFRIGFGGGFFDRLLSEARPDAIFIGLAFDLQIVKEVPRDPWDVPVHHIVTETQWIQTDNK